MSGSEREPADGDETASVLARGVGLFNSGEYEAAHEEFEQIWLSNEGADADFFKGLVQACIALHHFRKGNLAGAAKLYTGHRRYLGPYLPRHRGIDVSAFLGEMQSALRPVVHPAPGPDPVLDPRTSPRLRRVDG